MKVFVAGMVCALFSFQSWAESRVIGGKVVDPGTFTEVVDITSNGAHCTATIVGPRTLITAAHCVEKGVSATFTVAGKTYAAKMIQSSLYPKKDHDIAVGITNSEITGVTPVNVGGKAVTGLGIQLLGHGCTSPGTPSDGKLRIGESIVTGFSEYAMVSKKAGGAVLCYGDTGGPAFVVENGKRYLLGVSFKGNLIDTNYSIRIDVNESMEFLKSVEASEGVQICGVTNPCGGVDPVPQKPNCTLTANPPMINLGQSLTLSLVVSGQATAATVEGKQVGLPTASVVVTPPAEGSFVARANVTGPGGSNSCETNYVVKKEQTPDPEKPTCTLAAVPNQIKLGESLTLELTTKGAVTSASIDGVSVSFPLGKKLVTPTSDGTFTVYGVVAGPGGSNSCSASYSVEKDTVPMAETPNLTLVPAYCGDNEYPESGVARVCLAVLKRDAGLYDLRILSAFIITNTDATQEVLPMIHRKKVSSSSGETMVEEKLTLYANGHVNSGSSLVLDTREATLVSSPTSSRAGIPLKVVGRSMAGRYFSVPNLTVSP